MRLKALALIALTTPVLACDGDDGPKPCPTTPGTICTFAGSGRAGFDGDGRALHDSRFYWPIDIAFTSTGTYILDWNNHRVRRVTDERRLETVIGTDFVGDGDPKLQDLVKPGVPGTTVDLNHPTQILEMTDGKLLLVAWHNHKLRVYDPDTSLVYVLCGRGAGYSGDGEEVTGDATVLLNQPSAAVFDQDDNLYVLDQRNERIRRISADERVIETVVGTGEKGFSGDGGDPLEAVVNFPKSSNPPPAGGMAFDEAGRLYFSDILNQRIRRVDFAANVIETVYGNGGPEKLNNPRDLALGPDGRIYIADEHNHRVLALDVDTLEVEVVAGTGQAGFSGDYGPATAAQLDGPTGLDFDDSGDLYIADSQNHRIRLVRMGGQ